MVSKYKVGDIVFGEGLICKIFDVRPRYGPPRGDLLDPINWNTDQIGFHYDMAVLDILNSKFTGNSISRPDSYMKTKYKVLKNERLVKALYGK